MIMKKNFLITMAALAATGISLFSCTDDTTYDSVSNNSVKQEATATSNSKTRAGGVFINNGSGKDAGLYVRIDGNRAQVVRNAQAGEGGTNASVQFTNDNGGFITLDDNTIDLKAIPFCMTRNIMQLDMTGSADFAHCGLIYLNKKDAKLATRGGSEDKEKNKELAWGYAKEASQKLLSLGAKAMFGDVGQAMLDPVISMVFKADPEESNPNVKYFKEISNSIQDLSDQTVELSNKVNYIDVCKEYHDHSEKIHTLSDHNLLYLDLIKGDETKKDSLLNAWANATINNSVLTASLPELLRKMVEKRDNRTLYNMYDEYIFHVHPWEHEGYADRDMLRTFDMITLAQSCYLMGLYCDTKPNSINNYKETVMNGFEKYMDFMKYDGSYQKHEDKYICQLEGAYFEMDRALYEKTIGSYDNGKRPSGQIDPTTEFVKSNKWAESYIFSNEEFRKGKTELKPFLMTKKEAETISKHYVPKGQHMNYVFKNILGLDNGNNNLLLLSDKYYPNFTQWAFPLVREESKVEVNGSVYKLDEDKYESDHTLDNITFKNVNKWSLSEVHAVYEFRSTNPETVKYVKIGKHFKNYDEIIKNYRESDIKAAAAAKANN